MVSLYLSQGGKILSGRWTTMVPAGLSWIYKLIKWISSELPA